MHREVDVELTGKDKECNNKWKYWAWPDKDENAKEYIKCMPQGKSNIGRDIVLNTGEHGESGLFSPLEEFYTMRIDKEERDRQADEVWPNIKHHK